jgi:hypothetical protein
MPGRFPGVILKARFRVVVDDFFQVGYVCFIPRVGYSLDSLSPYPGIFTLKLLNPILYHAYLLLLVNPF